MAEYKRLQGHFPPELERIVREYAHPIHRKPEHGIMMTNLFNIIKKPIIKKFHNLINNDTDVKCKFDFLYNVELGYLFNNPLEYTQYANGPYIDFINRYDAKALNELLQKMKKMMTKSYCKLKNKPYNKKVGVKNTLKIKGFMKNYNKNMKFNNNSSLISNRFVELYNVLVHGLQDDIFEGNEEWKIKFELRRLDKLYYDIKIKKAKNKKERREIKKAYRNFQNNRMASLVRQYRFKTWRRHDILVHTYYYGYNKTTKVMKQSNLQRYQLNYQKRSCIYMH
ncbi:MAG: hypothetical protein CMD14_09340 [Flavobacteriales bacterium]|nr:hypothetical protein [Flavobacteriales bacterium]|tara:strand:+ start:8153 stop:8995 length:843 start_codon:yes stop_codon:yes gene_type:complete